MSLLRVCCKHYANNTQHPLVTSPAACLLSINCLMVMAWQIRFQAAGNVRHQHGPAAGDRDEDNTGLGIVLVVKILQRLQ
jgi:hypothetical protein